MTDYAKERRAYVAQVRDSFGQDMDEMQMRMRFQGRGRGREQEREREQGGWDSLWMRVRFGVSVFLFLLFFFWQSSGTDVGGITPAKMIDMIQDNRYDTILQEYDTVWKDAVYMDTE